MRQGSNHGFDKRLDDANLRRAGIGREMNDALGDARGAFAAMPRVFRTWIDPMQPGKVRKVLPKDVCARRTEGSG